MSRRIPGGKSISAYMPSPVAESHRPTDEAFGRWTMDTMRTAARMAASRVIGSVDVSGRFDVAWEGIALHVCSDPHSSWTEAIGAGVDAIRRENRAWHDERGMRSEGRGDGSRFAKFWQSGHASQPDILTPLTLSQVMDGLDDRHRDVLLHRAQFSKAVDAAEDWGIAFGAYCTRVRKAREAALALWFDHEAAPPLKRLPATVRTQGEWCSKGHRLAGNNILWDRNSSGRQLRRCRACRNGAAGAEDYSYMKAAS